MSCKQSSELKQYMGQQLSTRGVLLDDNKYFWLDSEARVSVQVYPKALSIAWGTDPRYWTFRTEAIPNTDYNVEVAKLTQVCWLDVNGEFDSRKLTMGTEYEILFDIELTQDASGWHIPVTFKHNNNLSRFNLGNLIGNGRTKIRIGRFTLSHGNPNVTFGMYEKGGHWKSGLIVHGVIIKPTN